jgi:hypothetical protein
MYAVLKPAFDSALKHAIRRTALTAVFWMPEERRIRFERWLRGYDQHKKLRAADVVVVSFGKSGRTWLRVMLSRLYQVRHGLPEKLLIGFDNFHLRHHAIPRIFFTHDNYTKDFTGNTDSKADYYDKRVVLLVRHPIDVAVSQYHQWKFRMRQGKKALNEYPDHGVELPIYDFVVRQRAGLDKAIEFLNDWARELPRVRELLIVRYEDMRADAASELRRVADFMGTPGTEPQIAEAVRYASFENMRRLEEKSAFWLSGGRMTARDKSNTSSFKTRRGKVGGWRDYFSEDEAREITRTVDSRLLPGFGYTSAEQPPPATTAPLPTAMDV